MKLFALIENVDESDLDFSEGIAMLFESKQQVTDHLMQKIIEKFETSEQEYGFDWEKIFGFHDEPKICEIETGKYYCPYDFTEKIPFMKFIDMNHEVFKRIDKHNKESNESNPDQLKQNIIIVTKTKSVRLKKKKEPELFTKLEKEVNEVNDIKYPYMDKYKK